ncbi:DUF5606 family protein [Galbibacter pacificus]|uniref:DUF5606 domain-containing protein n=1 Tax=Galbibacter pacificus TaxID=2996052 RepID=A0ABT6FV04_9FLAO|nr:DUF5606 domain-containing protein [Galbibacter pacificus]MDG3583610.1 DUF5606 domain-containing protein [Galbibacter pacificus]MDG3586914.1 DUF5606 domain-containing protein [Galbibacter pacificus]
MGLDKILAITGKPGLYELKAQTRSGIVAESLIDRKKISVGLRSNISLLSEIAIYTLTEEVPLKEVFNKIKQKENGEKTKISHKEEKIKLEEYFFEILPDYDEDKVYASDIKKVIQWYNLLLDYGITDFGDEEKSKKVTPAKAKTTTKAKASAEEKASKEKQG